MLSNEEIAEYKRLKKDVDEANVEKQTMKAEIKVFVQQGKEKLAKYGLESYSELPKLKEKLEGLEGTVMFGAPPATITRPITPPPQRWEYSQ